MPRYLLYIIVHNVSYILHYAQTIEIYVNMVARCILNIKKKVYNSTLISDTDIMYKYVMQSKQHRRGGRDGSGGGTHGLDGAHLVGYQARTHPKPPPTPRTPSFGVSRACRLRSLWDDYTFVIVSVWQVSMFTIYPAPPTANPASSRYIQSCINHIILHKI